ncbi:uncharacterized protein BCR38DRAFT_356525 [Pseudomassariella vexata]|uniref:Nudix hydrolase domain-containing protein n=1 Tax=Pseudomassariella vexata TaxID=1141098 RepID=A0A1Y2D9F3_9PEZI|nr:uncharacterized protein BCR38DRAFT_356525 [Pseudomassariella vexata]ORY55837.1 hypothetical protein BCR38DRAFT_356525 [Pseudomassariella vexata]
MISSSSYYSTASPQEMKRPSDPRPSSSVILLSPTNQVLLLHRVKTSSAFPSAHVFPGGNLSEFHDGSVEPPGHPRRHQDSLPYRLGAIRETFEESGILLARDGHGTRLLNLPLADRDEARKAVYANKVPFGTWLESVGGYADTANLIPFTRWITPPATPKRFTTQMYLYMLPLPTPLSADPACAAAQAEAILPTPDGSEVTVSVFEDAQTWLQRQAMGEIILFPPQAFLLTLVAQFCTGPPSSLSADSTLHYKAQRDALLQFLDTLPTTSHPKVLKNPTSHIPWSEKVICPATAMMAGDGRIVLSLDKPGPELRGRGHGGDFERVVLVKFERGGPRRVEVRRREEVFEEERRRLEGNEEYGRARQFKL